MKYILFSILGLTMMASNAFANYTLVVPSPKGTGTAIWGDVVAAELSKYLDERVVAVNIPGGKGNASIFGNRMKANKIAGLLIFRYFAPIPSNEHMNNVTKSKCVLVT